MEQVSPWSWIIERGCSSFCCRCSWKVLFHNNCPYHGVSFAWTIIPWYQRWQFVTSSFSRGKCVGNHSCVAHACFNERNPCWITSGCPKSLGSHALWNSDVLQRDEVATEPESRASVARRNTMSGQPADNTQQACWSQCLCLIQRRDSPQHPSAKICRCRTHHCNQCEHNHTPQAWFPFRSNRNLPVVRFGYRKPGRCEGSRAPCKPALAPHTGWHEAWVSKAFELALVHPKPKNVTCRIRCWSYTVHERRRKRGRIDKSVAEAPQRHHRSKSAPIAQDNPPAAVVEPEDLPKHKRRDREVLIQPF